MAGIIRNDNIDLRAPKPIRNTDIVGPEEVYTSKEEIPASYRFKYMSTKDENGVQWYLIGGIEDENWRSDPPNAIGSVPSIDNLRELNYSSVGTTVYVEGYYDGSDLGGGVFKAIKDVYDRYLAFETSKQQALTVGAGDMSVQVTTAQTIGAMFRFNQNPDNKYMASFNKSGDNIRLHFSTVGTTENYSYDDTVDSTFKSIVDFYGNEVEKTALKYGEWYTISVSPLSTVTIYGLDIGDAAANYPTFDIQKFWTGDLAFDMQENTGTTVTGSDDTTTAEITSVGDLPTWNTASYANIFNLFEAGSVLWQRQIIQNSANPFDFGSRNNLIPNTFTYDSAIPLQAWLDSGLNLVCPPCFLTTTVTLYARKPMNIQMSGKYKPQKKGATYESVKSLTVIATDQNIDVFRIQEHSVYIYDGLVDVSNASGFTKAGFAWDGNKRIWSGEVSTNVYGNEAGLAVVGIGGYGYHFDTEGVTEDGYFEDIKVSGDAYWMAIGTYVPPYSSGIPGNFHNGFTFTSRHDGCKQMMWVESSKCLISGMHQARAILPTAEKDLPAIYYRLNDSQVDSFVFDIKEEAGEPYRNFDNPYDIGGIGLSITGLMQRIYAGGAVNTEGLMLNMAAKIDNPTGYLLSTKQGNVSDVNNAIAGAGHAGVVSVKGFEATDDLWYAANLLPADDAGNPDTLAVSANVTITNASNLLKTDQTGGLLVGTQIVDNPNKEFNFAEIVITDLDTIQGFTGSDKINNLYLICGRSVVKIQAIIEFDLGTYSQMFGPAQSAILGGDRSYRLLNNTGIYKEYKIRRIIIRMIGTYDDANNSISDVVLTTQQNVNNPLVNKFTDQEMFAELTTRGYTVKRADGTTAGSILPSSQNDFGMSVGGIDEDGVLSNMLLFGSNIYIGKDAQYIANDNALPHGYLKLAGVPVTDDNGNDFYPVAFQQIEQELHTEVFTDSTNTILSGVYQNILTGTALVNTYNDPSDLEWSLKVNESSGHATSIELRFLIDGVPTGTPKTYTIGAGTSVTIPGSVQLSVPLSVGQVLSLECIALDTGAGRITTVVGTESATSLTVRQLGFGTVNDSSISTIGGATTTKVIGTTLIIELLDVATYTLAEISTLSSTSFFVKLKNTSGGDVVINTTNLDTIEGESSITLLATETIELYISTPTEFKL